MTSPTTRSQSWLFAMLLLCGACQAIVGIREREVRSSSSGVSSECTEYCAHVDEECAEIFPAYEKIENCEAVCAKLDPPESGPGSLTLACLKEHTGTLSEWTSCEAAGPSGGGKCGERCEVYCKLYPRICDGYPAGSNAAECEAYCDVLEVGSDLDAKAAFAGNDTLQCRLAHLAVAAAEARAGNEKPRQTHCGHARADLSGELCVDKAPRCERYCTVVMKACVGNNAQYESSEHCLAVCKRLPMPMAMPTDSDDKTPTPLACRLNNAYLALETPAPDTCMRAGPAGGSLPGDGCGSSCRGYCEQLSQACASAGFEVFGTNNPIDACTEECTSMAHDTHTRRFKCRLDNIAKALASGAINDQILCAQAFGQGMCAPGMGQ